MKKYQLFRVLGLSLSLAGSGIGGADEPEPENYDMLSKALSGLQGHKDDHFHTGYDKENKTSIYYRSVRHLSRVETAVGVPHYFLLHRIRSGSIDPIADTPPPRGSWVLAWYNKDMKLLGATSMADETTCIDGMKLKRDSDYGNKDLSKRKDVEKFEGVDIKK